jgi:hypothetical protein
MRTTRRVSWRMTLSCCPMDAYTEWSV